MATVPSTSKSARIRNVKKKILYDVSEGDDRNDNNTEDNTQEDLLINKLNVEILEGENTLPSPKCAICQVRFVNKSESSIHSMIHTKNHTCLVCKEFVKNRFQFVGHVRRHMCAKPFLCPVENCGKSFPSVRETKLHEKVHTDDRPFMCTECGKAFKQISTLKDHGVVHTGQKRFKCKICEGAFATATSLRRHVRVMHEAIRSFLCHFCEECYTSKQALKEHLIIHRDEDPLKCQLCRISFTDNESFTAHRDKHVELKESGICQYCANNTFYFALKDHIEKKHQPRNCEICSLVFFDDKSMENHKKSHSESPEKDELECKVCGKQFEFPRYLKAHLKRHEGDYRKFVCHLCSKGFSSKRDLNDHLMVHANVKNYFCDVCNKAFRTKQSVNKHKPIHSDKRPYQCKECPKRFKKQSILRKHQISHLHTRPFNCELCWKTYKSREGLRVHKFSHKKQKFKCDVCAKKFKFKSVFTAHKCAKSNNLFKPRYKCFVCRKKVKSLISLMVCHKVAHEHYNRSLFKCAECDVDFKCKYEFILHKIKHKNGTMLKKENDVVKDEVKDECDEIEGQGDCPPIHPTEYVEVKEEKAVD